MSKCPLSVGTCHLVITSNTTIMKMGILCSLLFITIEVCAQTAIEKRLPVQAGQKIEMHFDYPKLIKVTTWDKNEILVQGSVSINNGENDDAFKLDLSSSGGVVTLRNEIKDFKNLPRTITVQNGTEKIVFKNNEEFKKYKQQHGSNFNCTSYNVDLEIVLEIKVPRNVETRVESVYGMVEVKDFTGPLTVDATYGGVDASLTERSTGELTAETSFGDILTNLDVKFASVSKHEEDFHTLVSTHPGVGPKYFFGSKYGKVYLRKSL